MLFAFNNMKPKQTAIRRQCMYDIRASKYGSQTNELLSGRKIIGDAKMHRTKSPNAKSNAS